MILGGPRSRQSSRVNRELGSHVLKNVRALSWWLTVVKAKARTLGLRAEQEVSRAVTTDHFQTSSKAALFTTGRRTANHYRRWVREHVSPQGTQPFRRNVRCPFPRPQVNVGLALKIMAKIYPSESATDESLVSSAAIFGMMAGQVIFGALGDWLGRQLALCCTLLVCGAGTCHLESDSSVPFFFSATEIGACGRVRMERDRCEGDGLSRRDGQHRHVVFGVFRVEKEWGMLVLLPGQLHTHRNMLVANNTMFSISSVFLGDLYTSEWYCFPPRTLAIFDARCGW